MMSREGPSRAFALLEQLDRALDAVDRQILSLLDELDHLENSDETVWLSASPPEMVIWLPRTEMSDSNSPR